MDNNKIRRVHSPSFKTQVVLELLKGERTKGQICSQFGIHPTQAVKWRERVLAELPNIFIEPSRSKPDRDRELIDELYRQIGKLKYQLDWLKKKMGVVTM